MAQFNGLQGLGVPIDYFGMVNAPAQEMYNNSFRNDALEASTLAQRQQTQQAQREEARKQQFYQAIGSAKPDDLPALRRQFPEFAENIQAEIGVQDAEHAKFVNKALNNISLARSSGNPQLMQEAILKSAPALALMNMTTDQALQLLQSDPQRFDGLLKGAQLATLPYDKQIDVQQNQQRIDETIRSNKAGESLQARGQNLSYGAQMARLNHDKYVYQQSQAALNRSGQAQDMDVLSLNSQIASTGIDPLTGKQATGARMGQARKWLEGNNGYNEALITGERGIEKVDSLLGQNELEGIGRFAGRNPDATTSQQGLANRNAIEELKSGAFVQNVQALRGMGALSNAEGSKLENLIAKVDITQPEDVVRNQLKEIKSQYSVLQKVAGREAESMGYSSNGYDTYVSERKSQKGQQEQQRGIAEGTTATNPQTGQRIVYRSGKWQPL